MKTTILFILLIYISTFTRAQEIATDTILKETKLFTPDIEFSVNIYPNPTESFVNIDFENLRENRVEVSIYTIMGNLKETFNKNLQESSSFKLDLSGYKEGLYFIIFETSKWKTCKRLSVL